MTNEAQHQTESKIIFKAILQNIYSWITHK